MTAAASMMAANIVNLPPGTQLPRAAQNGSGLATASTLNESDFLTLLTTQLKHQDPLNPQNPSDFAAELAQFSTASGVANLNTALGTGSAMQAATLVGRNVAVAGNELVLAAGGKAAGAFNLSSAAKDVVVTVGKGDGSVMATLDLGPMAAGTQNFAWDGKGADGKAAPAGTYFYSIKAASGTTGAKVTATPYAVVPVTSVVLGGQSGPTLDLGGGLSPVPLSAVQQVF
jgi:flagellar basal-body rod modification protein FlgD